MQKCRKQRRRLEGEIEQLNDEMEIKQNGEIEQWRPITGNRDPEMYVKMEKLRKMRNVTKKM